MSVFDDDDDDYSQAPDLAALAAALAPDVDPDWLGSHLGELDPAHQHLNVAVTAGHPKTPHDAVRAYVAACDSDGPWRPIAGHAALDATVAGRILILDDFVARYDVTSILAAFAANPDLIGQLTNDVLDQIVVQANIVWQMGEDPDIAALVLGTIGHAGRLAARYERVGHHLEAAWPGTSRDRLARLAVHPDAKTRRFVHRHPAADDQVRTLTSMVGTSGSGDDLPFLTVWNPVADTSRPDLVGHCCLDVVAATVGDARHRLQNVTGRSAQRHQADHLYPGEFRSQAREAIVWAVAANDPDPQVRRAVIDTYGVEDAFRTHAARYGKAWQPPAA